MLRSALRGVVFFDSTFDAVSPLSAELDNFANVWLRTFPWLFSSIASFLGSLSDRVGACDIIRRRGLLPPHPIGYSVTSVIFTSCTWSMLHGFDVEKSGTSSTKRGPRHLHSQEYSSPLSTVEEGVTKTSGCRWGQVSATWGIAALYLLSNAVSASVSRGVQCLFCQQRPTLVTSNQKMKTWSTCSLAFNTKFQMLWSRLQICDRRSLGHCHRQFKCRFGMR
jgi:hypothetical protein